MEVEIWGSATASAPAVPVLHGLFRAAEVHAVLLCTCCEDDAFDLLGGAGDVESVEKVRRALRR